MSVRHPASPTWARPTRWLLATLGLASCMCAPSPSPKTAQALPDLRLEQVAARSWSNDKLALISTASRLEVFREVGTPGDFVAYDVALTFPSHGTRLSAPLVTGNLLSGQFTGQGGVRLEGPDSLRGAAPTVSFDRARGSGGEAWSDAGVVLTRPRLRLEATAFAFDVAEERASFHQVKTEAQTQH